MGRRRINPAESRHRMIAPDKERVSFILPKSLKEELKTLAEAERRTLSNFLEGTLAEAVARARADIEKTNQASAAFLKTPEGKALMAAQKAAEAAAAKLAEGLRKKGLK